MKSANVVTALVYSQVLLCAMIGAVVVTGLVYSSPRSEIKQDSLVLAQQSVILPTQLPTQIILVAPTVMPMNSIDAQQKISGAASNSLELHYQKPNELYTHTIESEKISEFYTIVPLRYGNTISVDEMSVDSVITQLTKHFERTSTFEFDGKTTTRTDRKLNRELLQQILEKEFTKRLKGTMQTRINITGVVDEFPASEGDLADTYLEVDKSQQALYQWEKGKVLAKRIISTGLSGPTPNGVRRIKNHFINAWSPIANVWTPYWMAFDYNSDAKAWLGFHELPYWDGANGERIRRSFDTLGKPITGGCIQLNIGDAEEVYSWATDGMIVLIHD